MSASTVAGASSELRTMKVPMTKTAMRAKPRAGPTDSVAKITPLIPSPNVSYSDKSKVGLLITWAIIQ